MLSTHPNNGSILGGITRAGVLQVAKGAKISALEGSFVKADFAYAREAFITSTTKHILPIVKLMRNSNRKLKTKKKKKIRNTRI